MEARLEAASRAGDLGTFRHLLQEDSLLLDRLSTTPYPYSNPIHIAALLGHTDLVSVILSRRSELVKDLNEQGFSPLHLASANGHLSVVKELLKLGSDICLIRGKDGFMPVHTAVIKGNICIVKELIDACPDAAKAATCQGETVVHLAVKSNRFEAVEFLVEKLGDDDQLLNSVDEKRNNILHLAIARKQLQILKLLLSQRAIQVNAINLKGFTPLDVLLESPSEHGDLVLGEMIRAAGGKKAEEEYLREPQSHPPIQIANHGGISSARSNWKYQLSRFLVKTSRYRRNLQAKREHESTPDTLMVVATLIATFTFQAGMNPPGGFVQDGSDAGKAILSDKLYGFLIFDMMGLFASLSIILLLICVVPRKNRRRMKFLKWVIWIAVVCTAIVFATVLYQIFPKTVPISIFLLGWCGIFAIATNWFFIRFSFFLLKKAGCLRRSTTLMGSGTDVKSKVIVISVFVLVGFIDYIVADWAFGFDAVFY